MTELIKKTVKILNEVPNTKTSYGSTYELASAFAKLVPLKIHIIQHEHKGIPEEPIILFDKDKAACQFELLVVEEGFRKRNADEYIDDYKDAYWDELRSDEPTDLDRNNTVRWWILPETESKS